MNILVFGGSGFLGSHLSDALSEAGHCVSIFDLRPSSWLRPDQTMIVGNALERGSLEKAIERMDVVYNLAGIADLDDARTRPSDTIQQNVLANAMILETCVRFRIKRFMYASTVYVYSEKGGFYRCSKQASEAFIEEFHNRYGLDFTILRYGSLYGPRADEHNSIYRYLKQALTNGKIEVSGTGEERREYIHVRDAARLSVEALDERFANTWVTLTGRQSMQFKEMLNMMREILGNQVEVAFSGDINRDHYQYTPYSYAPKPGYKLTSNQFVDLGQGLLECMAEVDPRNGRVKEIIV